MKCIIISNLIRPSSSGSRLINAKRSGYENSLIDIIKKIISFYSFYGLKIDRKLGMFSFSSIVQQGSSKQEQTDNTAGGSSLHWKILKYRRKIQSVQRKVSVYVENASLGIEENYLTKYLIDETPEPSCV